MSERVLFPDKACTTVWHGQRYNGQFYVVGDRLHVGSAYGSKDKPLKHPERLTFDEQVTIASTTLKEIVEARYGVRH